MQIRVPTDAEYRAIRDAVRFIELNRQRILRVIGRRFMPIIGDGSGGGASSTAVRLFKIERRKRLSTNPPRWGYFGREVTYDADDHSLSNVTGGWASDGVILSQADEDTDLATITAPTPGTVLEPNGDDEIDFTWSSAVGATNYKIDFGSTQGGTDYATSTTASTSYSLDAADLPGDGSVVYVRMQSYISSTWVYNDYAYYDADTDLHLARNVAELNSTNPSDTAFPGIQCNDVRQTRLPGTATLVPIGGYPAVAPVPSGEDATDWSIADNPPVVVFWTASRGDLTVAEFDRTLTHDIDCFNTDTPEPENSYNATMTSPTAGGTLTSTSQTFQWSSVTGALEYWLSVGNLSNGFGDGTHYDASQSTTTSQAVTGLPDDGRDLVVRIWTKHAVAPYWRYNDYTLTAYTAP
jgi:hypothetical protein